MKNVTVDLETIGLFRMATATDITEGNIVYLVGDGDVLYPKTVAEVLYPDDDWKAFCAEDGCRYGLYDLWVLKTGTELIQQIRDAQNVIATIKRLVCPESDGKD